MNKKEYKSTFQSAGTGAYLMGVKTTEDATVVLYDNGSDMRKFKIESDVNVEILEALIVSSINYPDRLRLFFSALRERKISFEEIDPYR